MQHKDIPEAELHQTKGAASASTDQIHYATGSGSTGWAKLTSSMVDTSSIKNTNKVFLQTHVHSIGAAFDVYVPIPFDASLTSVVAVINGEVSSGTLTTTIYNNTNIIGAFNYTTSDSTGSQRSPASYANTTFTPGSNIRVQSPATGVSSSATMTLIFSFTLT